MASTGTRLVLLLVLAALLLACWPWLFAPDARPDAPPVATHDGGVATAAIDRALAAAAPAAAPTPTPAVEREAAPAVAGATAGSLLVHVVWGDDKQPAEGVEVHLWRSGADSLFETPRGTSDPTGSVLFDALEPGNVYPSIDRGDHEGSGKVVIVAGQRSEVTLEVKMGMNAKGRVVDPDGAAVAGADIVLSDWGGGETQTLGQSAADGTFLLRAVGTHCHIGARKVGYVPTSMRQFTAADGATVDFTIVITRGGAVLEGVVLDPDDRPVAGAVVRAGEREQKNHKLPDGASAMAPQCEQLRTDAAGRFRFACVVPGKVPVAARARGLAPWHDDAVEVQAGRTTSLTIRLQAGVTVFGTVRDEAGAPLAKVEIEAGDYDRLSRLSAFSAADGSYRIEGLATGSLKVEASHDKRGSTSTTFEVVAGEQRRWDPVLTAGLQVRGRVLDHEDKPVASVMVEGQIERGSRDRHWHGFENTDQDGRFVMSNCLEGSSIRLSFRRKSTFPELVKNGVVPGGEELVVRLPKEAWVHIQGTVLGPDGEPLGSVHGMPSMKANFGGTPAETVDAKTGAFRYGPYPPGTYSLRFLAAGYPPIRLAERKLGPDEVWDTGTLHFEKGGTLAVQLVSAAAEPLPKLSLTIYDEAGAWVERVETDAGSGRTGPLEPGAYTLHVAGAAYASRMHPFEIRAERETRLDVPLQNGVATTIECAFAEPAAASRTVSLAVRDASGVVWRGSAWEPRAGQTFTPTGSRNATAQLALTPGDYTVEATCDDLRATGSFSVAAPGPAKAALTLQKP